MPKDFKKENWVFVESQNGKDYYINTVPTKRMVYLIGEKQGDKIISIKGDQAEYLPPIYRIIIKEYRKQYLESKKAEKEGRTNGRSNY